jgi:hypothetical protein
MDDFRRRFATLDAVPTTLNWAEVERLAATDTSRIATPTTVEATSVRRPAGRIGRPAATRPRSLVLLFAAATLVAALVLGALAVGGSFPRQNPVVDPSATQTAETTASPATDPTIAPTTPAPSAAAACAGAETPQEPRISDLTLPGKTTSPLGEPLVAGCALWVVSGENGGGIHRIDMATGAKTVSNPAEVVFDVDADGDELWAIAQPRPADALGHPVLYQLDLRTGATIRELPLTTFGSELTILDGRAWIGGWQRPLEVVDLESGELVASVDVAGGIQVGAGGVWSGLSRIDPVTFEVTELQTTTPVGEIVIVADRLYSIDAENGVVAQIDPVTGQVLTTLQVDDWTGGLIAAERTSIWILRVKEPQALPKKQVRTEVLRVDAASGQLAERIPIDVVHAAMFYATDGNLWLVDQPSRLRHGFIRVEVPAST